MKCEEAIDDLQSSATPQREAALQHVAECANCRAAQRAVAALAAERAVAVPRLAETAFDRALQRAVQPPRVVTNRRGFWLGTAVGGALAASLAVAVTAWWMQPAAPTAAANPQVRLALHEVRSVKVSLDSPESLQGAEIHVVLTGAIGLDGFAGQRELRWVTDLDRGVNQLTLPLVALGPNGGQVMVEVQHGDKRRAFVVDVQTADGSVRQQTDLPARARRPAAV
ncbi:MAG TPA: hypothetical protein VHH11_16585 [Gammaproteobacteria bacterium]|nr:hypothetical protein [Gammaproteobacteria bacterium]